MESLEFLISTPRIKVAFEDTNTPTDVTNELLLREVTVLIQFKKSRLFGNKAFITSSSENSSEVNSLQTNQHSYSKIFLDMADFDLINLSFLMTAKKVC